MGVSELWVEFDGPIEEFQGVFMLLLDGEAVADDDPGLRSEEGLFEGLVG